MRIPGVKTSKKIARWLRARITGGALILGYHRLGNASYDEYAVCVTPEHFDAQMAALRKFARPMPLSKLVQCLKEGSVPPRSVAVTFDDGYADNLYAVKPILEKYEIPATVFACTGYAGKEFWWDELDRMVMSSKADFESLRLMFKTSQFRWNRPHQNQAVDLDTRRKFRRDLYNLLLALDIDEQTQATEIIRDWSGVSPVDTLVRAMTTEELLKLVDGGLLQLGAHTRHHPMLPALSVERQREEIAASKQDLETLLNQRVDGFAYPNGRATESTKQILRDEGFVFACTSLEDVVSAESDLHALPRFWQKDVDGDAFVRGLRVWMRGD